MSAPEKNGHVPVPGWVAAVSTVLGWAAGSAILAVELLGQQRATVLCLAAWLITLPVIAFDPTEAIRAAVRELKGSDLKGKR